MAGIDDITCDDLTYYDLNQECEILDCDLWYNVWWSRSCERGWDGWYNTWWSNIWLSKSRLWDYDIGIDDTLCDDITCDDLNPELEIVGLGLMI